MISFIDLPPMEEKCRNCNGVGTVPWEYVTVGLKNKKKTVKTTVTCTECKGRGKLLTDFGKAIVQLMKDYRDEG